MRLDHAERRTQLAEAVWRIVGRDGVRAASVRGVAREAGLSMGSVRYFFATQDELLHFAMREVIDKAGRRIEAGAPAREAMVRKGRGVDAAVALLAQVVPLDDERLTEARVYAAFTGNTVTDPGMAAIQREADSAVRQLCRACLDGLAELGDVDPGRDLEVETERVWSILDGLTMHILLDPAGLSAKKAESVLRTHLGDLHAPPRRLG